MLVNPGKDKLYLLADLSKPKNKTQSFLTPSLDKVRNQSVPTQVTKLTLAEPKVIQDKTPKPALNTQKEIKVEKNLSNQQKVICAV